MDFSNISDDQLSELFKAILVEIASRTDAVQAAAAQIFEDIKADVDANAVDQVEDQRAELERQAAVDKQKRIAEKKRSLCEELHDICGAVEEIDTSRQQKTLELWKKRAGKKAFVVRGIASGMKHYWDGKHMGSGTVASQCERPFASKASAEKAFSKIDFLNAMLSVVEFSADEVTEVIENLTKVCSLDIEVSAMKFEIWERKADRRVYASWADARFGDNCIQFFETGTAKNPPGTVITSGDIDEEKAIAWCKRLLSEFKSVVIYTSTKWV